ncbi:mechanosensitive ion channel family protein [Thermococcus sp. M39]|nr:MULTISPECIES: mechanosensitive ion channel family protein [unclassified Thermococcus]NJE09204.1 mechanosensitive ion channel family protein [Thermococcus sp. M39]NJE13760.1 mechanosensitive ion channel family protein [Thermococcus sp. LS2]
MEIPINTTSLFSSLPLANITLTSIIKAVLILAIGLILANIFKKWIIKLSRVTEYVWLINEETADIVNKLIMIVALIYALDTLGILSIEIAGTTLSNIIAASLVFYFLYLIAKKSKDYLLMSGAKKGNLPEVQLKAKLFYYSLLLIALLISLNIAGFTGKLTTLMVAGGITGIVLGFSAQTVIANFISGIFMYFDKPLKIGDPVEVAGYSGVVNDIRILSTRIRTWDGTLVRIPNEKIFNSEIRNLQKYPARRVDVLIGIAYKEDISRAIEVIKKTLEEMPLVLAEPEPAVYVNELAESSVNIYVKAWAPSEKWFDVRSTVLQKIKEALEREGIEIPFPQRVNWFAEELRVKVEKE